MSALMLYIDYRDKGGPNLPCYYAQRADHLLTQAIGGVLPRQRHREMDKTVAPSFTHVSVWAILWQFVTHQAGATSSALDQLQPMMVSTQRLLAAVCSRSCRRRCRCRRIPMEQHG